MTEYILFNLDTESVILASEDEDLLNEYACDIFMRDVYYEFLEALQHWSDVEPASEVANEIFENNLDYWYDYIAVIKVPSSVKV